MKADDEPPRVRLRPHLPREPGTGQAAGPPHLPARPGPDPATAEGKAGRQRLITAFGARHTAAGWAAHPEAATTAKTIQSRLDRGWKPERAITTPPRPRDATYTLDGQTRPLRDWVQSDRCTVTYATVKRRLASGLDPKIAITAPANPANANRRKLGETFEDRSRHHFRVRTGTRPIGVEWQPAQ